MLTKLLARGLFPNACLYVTLISPLSKECYRVNKHFLCSSIHCCLQSFGLTSMETPAEVFQSGRTRHVGTRAAAPFGSENTPMSDVSDVGQVI